MAKHMQIQISIDLFVHTEKIIDIIFIAKKEKFIIKVNITVFFSVIFDLLIIKEFENNFK
jgi:hypothetical protein